jgi:hypothetical protein
VDFDGYARRVSQHALCGGFIQSQTVMREWLHGTGRWWGTVYAAIGLCKKRWVLGIACPD